MARVYRADTITEARPTLRFILLDLHVEVAGEAAGWATTLALAGDIYEDKFFWGRKTMVPRLDRAGVMSSVDPRLYSLDVALFRYLNKTAPLRDNSFLSSPTELKGIFLSNDFLPAVLFNIGCLQYSIEHKEFVH